MMRLLFLIPFLLAAVTSPVSAVNLRHLSVNEGMTSNMINTIYQDGDGFMYFGTASGLHRFDGYQLESFTNNVNDSTSLVDNYVQDIQSFPDGRLLIKAGEQYCLFDPKTEKFQTNISTLLNDWGLTKYPQTITTDGDDLWFHVADDGIYRYSPQKGLKKVNGINKSMKGMDVTDLIVKSDHKEAFAVTEHGDVLFINPGTMSLKGVAKTPDNGLQSFVYTLFADRDGILWIFAQSGLFAFDTASDKWIDNFSGTQWPMAIPNTVTQDRKGRIWIGYNHNGIAVLNKNGNLELAKNIDNDSRSLPANSVTSLFEDKTGTMWIGTLKKGISIYNESSYKFDFHKFPDVNCIISSNDGNLWIGTDTNGLFLTDQNFNVLRYYGNGDKSDAVVCLLQTDDGTLYAGTYAGGIMRIKNGVLSKITKKDGLASDNVWAMRNYDDGRILIATLGGGLQIWNPKNMEFQTFNTANSGLKSRFTTSLTGNDKGLVYVGTSEGVAIFDKKSQKISMLSAKDKSMVLSNPNINQVFVDSRGLLWIASRNGLNIYNPEKNVLMEVDKNVLSGQNFILGITEDRNHSMWISAGPTLTNIIVTPTPDSVFPQFTFHKYNSSDGLQDCEFNQRSFCMLPNGEMLVGGLYGINSFKPETILFNTFSPNVMLTSLQLFNRDVEIGKEYDGHVILPEPLNNLSEIRLDYSQNDFSIYFSTDDYVLPEKTTFSYRLEGFNNDWTDLPVGVHHVSYTNLSPGTYTLYVKATNNDGIASPQPKSVIIKITPPWYASTLAIIIYVLLFIALILLTIYVIRKRERRIYRRKIREENHRKQEELNQMKFKFFTNISHELRTPLTLITAPLDSMIAREEDDAKKKKLTIMQSNANRLLNLVNQLLDFRKNEMSGLTLHLSQGNIVAFARHICDSFLTLSEKKNINFHFHAATDDIPMAFDEDKMGKTIMNLLSNAFKYTPDNGSVDMDISTSGDNLIMSVSDSGKGISDDDKKHIFDRFFQSADNPNSIAGTGIGLSMVAEYVKLHSGNVSVSDNPSGGSIFTITIPIKKVDSIQSAKPQTEISSPSDEDTTSENKSDETDKNRILVVDDNPDMLALLEDELGSDYEVVTAENGKRALEEVNRLMPDFIISDIMMPEMDGIELCRRLKSNPDTVNIPLMILTAKHDVAAKIEGLTLGADDYLTKPFNIEVLKLRIDKLLSLKQKGMKGTLIDPEPQKIEITSLDEQLVEKAVKYVENNMHRPELTVEEMSADLGMSRVHLYKRLKQLTGKTPIEFIRVIRLKRAAQLLRESQLNVSEIAYRCGFNNPKYFSKYFKDEFGVLPSLYQDTQSPHD